MNLLFNLVAVQPIHSAKFHGGGSYGEVIFWALLRKMTSDENLFCAYDAKKYLDPEIEKACADRKIPLIDINAHTPQEIVDENQIDTFYTPLYSLEKKWEIQVKRFVFTWHGVRALEMQYENLGIAFAKKFSQKLEALVRYRESWKKHFYKPKYQSLAERIAQGNVDTITVSEHSKASIKAFFPVLMNAEIPVFYSPMTEYEPKGKLPEGVTAKKYFLLTSGARWEKNNLRAAMAFDKLVELPKIADGFKLVITGAINPKVYLKNLKHPERFVLLNYVESEELEFLHQNAYAFVFPSLNEGFGYPPVQSMRYGVPVVASGSTSIPEICSNAVLYFDPYSISEMENRMLQLLNSEIYREYSEKALVRYSEVHKRQNEDLEKAVDFILNPQR